MVASNGPTVEPESAEAGGDLGRRRLGRTGTVRRDDEPPLPVVERDPAAVGRPHRTCGTIGAALAAVQAEGVRAVRGDGPELEDVVGAGSRRGDVGDPRAVR